MARFYLINSAEQIVHKFDALDLLEARSKMRDFCMQDLRTYELLVAIRRATVNRTAPIVTVDDAAV